MAEGEVLKRLGGGRWKTADDRFTIEPQSGSWVLVDSEQTDDLGLPLVRGPYGSLTAARAAIDAARTDGAPISPLAARVAEERLHPRPAKEPRAVPSPAGPGKAKPAVRKPPKPEPPPPPPEPAWIGELPPARQDEARRLIERLTKAGVPHAELVARAEVADGEPAVARAALERQLRQVIERSQGDRQALISAVIALLSDGRDQALRVRWRVVDGDDRPLAPLPPVEPKG